MLIYFLILFFIRIKDIYVNDELDERVVLLTDNHKLEHNCGTIFIHLASKYMYPRDSAFIVVVIIIINTFNIATL